VIERPADPFFGDQQKAGTMVSDQTAADDRVKAASEARDQAELLLRRLLADRERSEARFAEAGKRDPVTYVTGASALDCAISSTREMLRHLNELIAELESDIAAPAALTEAPAKILQTTTAR
jgi:hypothetical protein